MPGWEPLFSESQAGGGTNVLCGFQAQCSPDSVAFVCPGAIQRVSRAACFVSRASAGLAPASRGPAVQWAPPRAGAVAGPLRQAPPVLSPRPASTAAGPGRCHSERLLLHGGTRGAPPGASGARAPHPTLRAAAPRRPGVRGAGRGLWVHRTGWSVDAGFFPVGPGECRVGVQGTGAGA